MKTCSPMCRSSASALLTEHQHLLLDPVPTLPVLDLACGSGRNGLHVLQQGVPVVFADRRLEALEAVRSAAEREQASAALAQYWPIDLERDNATVLAGKCFSGILVFRYLHRPLMEEIRAATAPGGLVFYETFTRAQREFGRPYNPDFLLESGELETCFKGWHIVHHFEGVAAASDSGQPQAIARIVARKPGESAAA